MSFRPVATKSDVAFIMALTLVMACMVTVFFLAMTNAGQQDALSAGWRIGIYGVPLSVWLAVLTWARYVDKSRETLNKMESFNASIIEVSTEAIIVIDQRGLVTLFSPAAERLFGYSGDEILGRNISLLMPEAVAKEHDAYLDRYLSTGERHIIGMGRIVVALDKMGREIPIRISIGEFRLDKQRFFVWLASDFSERLDAERKLGQFGKAVDANPDLVYITDAGGLIEYVNPAFTALTGWSLEEARGRKPGIIDHPDTPRETLADMAEKLRRGEAWRGRLPITHKNPTTESARWLDLSMAPIRDDQGRHSGFVALGRDVTEKIQEEQRETRARESAELRVKIGEILHSRQTLKTRLTGALDSLLSMADLALQKRGGIFLLSHDDEPARLNLYLTQGEFSAEFPYNEAYVNLGSRLCGRAALSGELLVSNDCFCDPRHEHRYPGMRPHGHYIVPLSDARNTLGVLFLYTDPYPNPDPSRLEMLRLVGQMMGLAIADDVLQQRLREARDAAIEATRLKSRFLANISHEIRTPMNGLLGTLDLLRDAPLAESQSELLRTGYGAARKLQEILNDLLDYTGLESGKLTIEPRDFDLYPLVDELLASFGERAAQKGLQLLSEITPGLPASVKGDPTRLRQVLNNLLDNAVKFTSRGKIALTIKGNPLDDGRLRLEFAVSDTGMGIAPEMRARIFEGFVQGDGSSTRNQGGTGLGLALSREIVALMGGDLAVESQPGAGSTFRFSLILEATGNRAAGRETDHSGQPATVRPGFHGHVLLVEDNPTNEMVAKRVLSGYGLSVDTARDGMEALARVASNRYDLAFMDCQMPVMDGYMATRELRRREAAEGRRHLPVIAMTANAMAGDRESCLEAGMDDYLAKPITRDDLLEALKRWLQPAPDLPVEAAGSDHARQSADVEQPESPAGSPIQEEALVQLRDMMGPAFAELIDTYIGNVPNLLDDLRTGIASGDLKQQFESMHSLKSNSALLGAKTLSGLAAEVETQARLQNPASMAQLDTVRLEFDRVRESLIRLRACE